MRRILYLILGVIMLLGLTLPMASPALADPPCDKTYDFNIPISNAFYCDIDNVPPTGGNLNSKTSGDYSQYNAIAASDNTRWTTLDPDSEDEVFMWFDMIIDELPAAITNIDLTFEGNCKAH